MMAIVRNIILGTMIFFLFGCNKMTIAERQDADVSAFNEIQLNSSFDLYLTEGPVYDVRIEGEEAVIDQITYTVTDSVLTIENTRKFKWLTPTKNKIKVYVTSPPLKTVRMKETSFVKTLTPITSKEFGIIFLSKANNADLELDCDVFYYWNSYPCGGTLTLHGQCNWLKIWNVAIVDVQAENLLAKEAEISNNSKGDCVVNVSDFLKYTVQGEGNIEVYGDPIDVIEYEPSVGTGKLILN